MSDFYRRHLKEAVKIKSLGLPLEPETMEFLTSFVDQERHKLKAMGIDIPRLAIYIDDVGIKLAYVDEPEIHVLMELVVRNENLQ